MRIISWQTLRFGALGSLLAFLSCGNSDDSTAPSTTMNPDSKSGGYTLEEAYPHLTFNRPVDFQHAGDNSNRVFVVEQRGVITVFEDNETTNQSTTFLDISGPVDDRSNEEGLLGLAFAPDYATSGHFFVNYTMNNPARTRISRFTVSSANPNRADPDSELAVLEFEQPFGNHNGGQLAFGPEGYLYVAVGDGGSAGDPRNHGQDRTTLLGSILRIDVSQASAQAPYTIPTDNPFAGNNEGSREEIFAYGLRNPWRISFDAQTGQLWAGDVGQNELEEVDIIVNGGNYGWNTTEASQCFEPSNNCDKDGIILPVWEYDHSRNDLSITGGYVYRGTALPDLSGLYVYADFVSGRVWALDANNTSNPENTELLDSNLGISSFGVNAENELFLCAFDGNIYRIDLSSSSN